MSKTIKEIAVNIGVSKQAVYKRIKGSLHTVVAPYMHTVDGVLYVDEAAETLIKNSFDKSNPHTYVHTDTPNETEKNAVALAIKALQNQLEEKDKQIERLQQALIQQQQLHQTDQLKTLQLTDGNKKHWWNKKEKPSA